MTELKEHSKQKKLSKRITLGVGRVLLKTFFRIASWSSDRCACRIGSCLGDLLFLTVKRYRIVAIKNLSWVYRSEMTPKQIHETARSVFRNFAMDMMEFLRLPFMSDKELDRKVILEGKEYLDEALAKGKGAILITAHFGNWELMASKLVKEGYPLNVIARDADDQSITNLVNDIRQGHGYKVFSRDDSMLPVVHTLKHNEVLGILPDQHDCDGIWAPFFGRPALTPQGPAALARMTGAVVLPGFSFRQPDNTIVVKISKPFHVEKSSDKEKDIAEWTAKINHTIEDHIRMNPTQWLWLHNRWKDSPEFEPEISEKISIEKSK